MSKVHEVVRRDLTFRVSTVPLVAGVTSGFVPATRRKVFVKLQPLVVPNCFFCESSEKGRCNRPNRRWHEEVRVRKTRGSCVEWTDGDHLRHAKFAGLRDDKDARSVAKELAGEGQPLFLVIEEVM